MHLFQLHETLRTYITYFRITVTEIGKANFFHMVPDFLFRKQKQPASEFSAVFFSNVNYHIICTCKIFMLFLPVPRLNMVNKVKTNVW